MGRHGFRGLLLGCGLLLVAGPSGFANAEDLFDVSELPSPGRTVAAEIVDLDGDGRADLLEIAYMNVPPHEKRRIRVRFQTRAGGFAPRPDLEVILPPGSAAYDLADIFEGGGRELLLLEEHDVVVMTFADGVQTRRLGLPEGVTIGAGPDERGLDRLAMVTRALAPEPWIVVPGINESFLLDTSGKLRARLSVGGRANYFVQPPGAMMTESDIQIFFDTPRLQFADVDGDGRTDAVAAGRHELRVFLRRPDGSLPREPDRRLWLARVSLEDHVRGSGAVRSMVRDLDGDGLGDLVIAQISGGILDSKATTSIHMNRNGGWNLEEADTVIQTDRAVSGVQLIDLDGDGRLELLNIHVPVTVLEIIEILVTRAFDANFEGYAMNAEGRFSTEPRFALKLGIPLNFETSRIRGFIPTFDHDYNGDGLPDLLTSGDGTHMDVFLGSRTQPYAERAGRQPLDDLEGMVRSGDLDGDGLADLVLFNPRRPNAPIRVAHNRGVLPGTPPSLRARPD